MEQLLEIAGTLVGILYLWLEYKASIYLWVASIIMPAIYLIIYYNAGLYADFCINIYYLVVAVYGWFFWRYGSKGKTGHPTETEPTITHIPISYSLMLALVFVITFFFIAILLIYFTDSNVPWFDSFTTALSFIGMWMLARKYLEQWIIWMIVDLSSVGLYIYKGLDFTAALYAFYAIIAIFGYRKWKRMIEK